MFTLFASALEEAGVADIGRHSGFSCPGMLFKHMIFWAIDTAVESTI